MGHKRQRQTLNLRFEDEPGLEILARSVSLGKFLDLMKLADKWGAGNVAQADLEEVAGWFAERIVTWNLEDDDGQPVPVTAQYLIDEDVDWMLKVVLGWVAGIVQVIKVPLERSGLVDLGKLGALAKLAEVAKQANGASPEMEASIPMSPVTPD